MSEILNVPGISTTDPGSTKTWWAARRSQNARSSASGVAYDAYERFARADTRPGALLPGLVLALMAALVTLVMAAEDRHAGIGPGRGDGRRSGRASRLDRVPALGGLAQFGRTLVALGAWTLTRLGTRRYRLTDVPPAAPTASLPQP